MALESGTQLGTYEISDLLGKGGMGEVYRARDTKLGREVAIKVLPSEFSQDQERLARLEREARMLAALNHPNIAAIHGLEEHEGSRFLVLELVEGDTLADRLKRGVIPVEESLTLALQIAEALEAAHEKGVIHRDLKPANIKITPEGRVKVLDFGLAKAFIGEQADVNLSNSPTLSMQATQAGIILGTAAYMSPEQARGEPADAATDVWAFGCVLFEMLTGTQAFQGRTVSDVMAAVLAKTPSWESLPPNLGPRARFLLERCLEKEQADRCQRIAEVRGDLGKATADPHGEAVRPVAENAPPKLRPTLAWIAVVLAAVAVTGFTAWNLRSPAPGTIMRFAYVLPDGQLLRNPQLPAVAVSHDGSKFVYNSSDGLYLRSMDQLEAGLIQGTEEPVNNVTFSPDGEWLAYWSLGDQEIKKIATVGGAPVRIWSADTAASNVLNIAGLSWDVDDAIVFQTLEGIWQVSDEGGEPELVLADSSFYLPQLLPDGQTVLLNSDQGVAVKAPGVEEPEMLFPGTSARYLATGHIVYSQNNAIFAVPFDLGSLSVTGGAVDLVQDALVIGPVTQYSVSDTGTLVYAVFSGAAAESDGFLAMVEESGEVERLDGVPDGRYRGPRVSPDGRFLAVERIEDNGSSAIWVYDFSGAQDFRRLPGTGSNGRPIWTPDSQRLTFASDREGAPGIWWQAADGSTTAQRLTTGNDGILQWPGSWNDDGTVLAFTNNANTQNQGIWILPMDEEGNPGEPEELVPLAGAAAFSPNGSWIAYRSDDDSKGPRNQVHVQPYPPTGALYPVTEDGGSYPMWSGDAQQQLYYRRPNLVAGGAVNVLARRNVGTSTGFTWEAEEVLELGGFMTFRGYRDYDFAPDRERVVMIFPVDRLDVDETPPPTINIVLNWFGELKERVPVP